MAGTSQIGVNCGQNCATAMHVAMTRPESEPRYAAPPVADPIGVGAVFKEPRHPLIVLPVQFPVQHCRQAVGAHLAAAKENVQRSIVQRLGRVVWGLAVIGIRAASEQKSRQLRVVRDARGAIDGTLKLRRVVVGGMKAGVRTGPRVQQGSRCAQEALGARGGEAQVT
jgi:hypothetical protein